MNNKSSVGLTEELLTNLINITALEYHLRITVEKYYSQLRFNTPSDKALFSSITNKLDIAKETLQRTTEQRRGVMRALQSMATEDGNEDMWCAVKHASIQMITMFEAWQVDMDNVVIEELYHKSVELFNVVVAQFLGFIPQPCSACFSDALKSQEEFNALSGQSSDIDSNSIIQRAEEVFGSVPNSLLEASPQ